MKGFESLDLNLPKIGFSAQETGSIFKGPHLHRANLVTVCNQSFIDLHVTEVAPHLVSVV